ncbi:MAG: hypothetical protein ACLGIJ_01095 [Candidatus Limnocylindria bacterium]
MIRDAVLHLNSEQPMLADLYGLPDSGDVGLRCTNLRTMGGQRPVFVDDTASIFFFPYLHIRFVEIPPAALRRAGLADASEPEAVDRAPAADGKSALEPVAVPAPAADDGELEIDEDFLRRIREV